MSVPVDVLEQRHAGTIGFGPVESVQHGAGLTREDTHVSASEEADQVTFVLRESGSADDDVGVPIVVDVDSAIERRAERGRSGDSAEVVQDQPRGTGVDSGVPAAVAEGRTRRGTDQDVVDSVQVDVASRSDRFAQAVAVRSTEELPQELTIHGLDPHGARGIALGVLRARRADRDLAPTVAIEITDARDGLPELGLVGSTPNALGRRATERRYARRGAVAVVVLEASGDDVVETVPVDVAAVDRNSDPPSRSNHPRS